MIEGNTIMVMAIVHIDVNSLNECLSTHRITLRNCNIFAYRIETTRVIINLGLMLT